MSDKTILVDDNPDDETVTLRALIVEDLADDAALIVRELRRGGYDVRAERVETGPAMRAALEREPWDVVLSDNSLPGFSATAALGVLRGTGSDLPFILVSGSIGEDAAVAAMKAGAHDYVFKGNLARLVPAVQRELREAESRRERRRAEQALLQQREFLRQVIDTDPSLIFVKDWDGRFTLVNQAVARVYGTTVEALLGKTDADFNPNPAEVEHFLQDDREVMTSRRPKFIPEEPVTNPGTSVTRWFQTVKVPIVSADGTARAVLGVATDITERRQLEEQFRQAQKMEAVGRLAGGIAHDFNNLLTAIIGSATLLLEDLAEGDPKREDVQEIAEASHRAAALTRQLLAFSRKQVLQPVALDLNGIVANMDKMLRRLIGSDIELRTALSPHVGTVRADPSQMDQILMNLVVNARDAMPQGGRLTIETANVELDAAYAQNHVAVHPGPYVMLAVSDTGVGMGTETKAHLFEPFFTTKEAGKGTGLGLATVYGIVKQSGGNIWVYSEPGHGATFKIYLPRIDRPAEVVTPTEGPAASDRGSETVLLVEDEPLVRALVRRVLEQFGYTVLAASGAAEALPLVEGDGTPVALLVTDVVMPSMSGRELARLVVARRPGIKVLFLSGYTDDAIVSHGLLERGTAFLQKPFTPQALVRKVRELLQAP